MNLDEAAKFRDLVVEPMVDAVRAEVRPVVQGHKDLHRRVAKLEQNQKRALLGLTAAASVASVVLATVLDWVKRKLGLHAGH